MPYTFIFTGITIFVLPICFVAFFICSSLFTPPKFRLGKRILVSFVITIVIPVSFMLLIVCMDCMHGSNYWRDDGSFDSFRVPLEPPYELTGSSYMAQIQIWQDRHGFQLGSITHYEKREYLIFGETSHDAWPSENIPEHKEWFIFDLSNGEKTIFQDESEFIAALSDMGIVDIKLKNVWQNWNEYWNNPHRKVNEKPSTS